MMAKRVSGIRVGVQIEAEVGVGGVGGVGVDIGVVPVPVPMAIVVTIIKRLSRMVVGRRGPIVYDSNEGLKPGSYLIAVG